MTPELLSTNCRITIYHQGTPKQLTVDNKPAFIEGLNSNARNEIFKLSQGYKDEDIPTHLILIAEPDYNPQLQDYIIISSCTNNVLNGRYLVKEYPKAEAGEEGEEQLNCVELKVRFLGIKKPGDTGPDNTGNFITAGRK